MRQQEAPATRVYFSAQAMFPCPIGLRLENTSSKIKLVMSRWQWHNIKLGMVPSQWGSCATEQAHTPDTGHACRTLPDAGSKDQISFHETWAPPTHTQP